jgi:hypothetical protein
MKNNTSEENNKNLSANKIEDNINFKLIWNSLSKNYNEVEGAPLSDSFIILLTLMNSKLPFLTTNQISGIVSKKSQGEIYKNPRTTKDILGTKLVHDAFVSSKIIEKRIRYSITPKGEKLLKDGLASFLLLRNAIINYYICIY